MNNPLISILIPCFNGENFIDQCLESATKQTYKNIEILIMNDGSEDNSLSKFKNWAKKDKRIKIFSQENKGLARSRNELIKNAKGLYFTLLDIDDTLLINSVELLFNKSFDGKADIVVGRTNGVYKNGQVKVPYFPVWRRRKEMTNLQYVKSNICTPWSSIIRKNFFDKLDVEFLPNRVFEDVGLMPYLYLKANIFVAISEITYNYHKYESNSISNFKVKSFSKRNDLLANTKYLFERFKLEGWDRDKGYRRAINGILLILLLLNDILVRNFTSDLKTHKLLRHNFYTLLESFGWEIKLTKTPWKFFGFIYLKMTYMKINRKGSIFFRTFKINSINLDNKKKILSKNKTNILKFNNDFISKKIESTKNSIIEVKEIDYIKNSVLINSMKSKYILIDVSDISFIKFSSYLSHENINGIAINGLIFEPKYFRENENFLVVCIKYDHIDEFSLKKLLSKLNELNYMLRRPLIFLKCQKNKKVINATKKMIDSFIFISENEKEEILNVK